MGLTNVIQSPIDKFKLKHSRTGLVFTFTSVYLHLVRNFYTKINIHFVQSNVKLIMTFPYYPLLKLPVSTGIGSFAAWTFFLCT